MLRLFDDDSPRVGIVEDVSQLGIGIAIVDVDRHRADLQQAEQTGDVFDAVLEKQ